MPEDKNQNNNVVDAAIFDETLREIDQTIKNLGHKIEPNQDFLENKKTDKKNLENIEHTIDNSHLPLDVLENYNSKIVEQKNNSFGFYSYLTLITFSFFFFYVILGLSREFIILKYPLAEPAIIYFYEIIEILNSIVLTITIFLKSIILELGILIEKKF
jgi:hypothetical protein